MSLLVIILAIFIISLTIMASFLTFRWRQSDNAHYLPSIAKTVSRKLSADEYQSIESYLQHFLSQVKSSDKSGYPALPVSGDEVYTINHTILRFSAVSEETQHWRYYIDETEIYVPALLEPFVKQQNSVDMIQTASIPLVIAVNGHYLTDYQQELLVTPNIKKTKQASIQKNGNSDSSLMYLREETPEEYRLRRSTGVYEAILICAGLLLWFLGLFMPPTLLLWLGLTAVLCFLISLWPFFRLLYSRNALNISCFSGVLKRWSLFSEFASERQRNISLGGIDPIYPIHWEPYLVYELGQNTHVDMYANNHVVRQGRYLSLHEEEKRYPYQRYCKNQMLVVFAILAMFAMYFNPSVNLSIRLGFAKLHSNNTEVIDNVNELLSVPLREGDVLRVKGTGMCYMPPILSRLINQKDISFINASDINFIVFNCAGVYWNSGNTVPILESAVVDKASALISSVHEQLHPLENNRKTHSEPNNLATKSGMTLLDNFPQIILNTQTLCLKETDCIRLKNALVNLSSAKNWDGLLQQAETGKLDGTRVVLRSVSAEALSKLVYEATDSFIMSEMYRVGTLLNSPPPGGVLLISDNKSLPIVEYPPSTIIPYAYTSLEIWKEMLQWGNILTNTPFETEGIVMEISDDANGTRRIILHNEPDPIALVRYLGSCLFLLVIMAMLIINGALVIKKKQKNKQRLLKIKQYYDHCFNPKQSTIAPWEK
ncbi:MAG: intracellular growth attenuator family protein [Enterobacteriaceae bacterium]|jgi:hypothetical protein|nr:intracellular growth attenuator family protein [Enterobacteriaceae bacterium]